MNTDTLVPHDAEAALKAEQDRFDRMFDDIDSKVGQALGAFETGSLAGMPQPVQEAWRAMTGALNAAQLKANGAHSRIRDTASNDALPKEHRERVVRETRDQGESEVNDAIERARTHLAVLEANLRAAAVGSPDANPTSRQLARDEIRLTLDQLDPTQVPAAAVDLAGRNGDLASELLGRWGRAYLQSRGFDNVRDFADIETAAIAGLATHGQGSQRQAASAWVGLRRHKIAGQIDARLVASRYRLGLS
ncbi:hypothetical protein [Egicoccus halophilus]|uniref:Uncharacterized protein n=1 Tax=Egicoccus halophilus TaxID=1670830 RepID=A0A8J3A940_9ACTN|nr:hypothetical protein [Egicoccus halophilus]GGI07223.1 hypothetical protein GCM10011354_23010 [Egicoccus halophilus]